MKYIERIFWWLTFSDYVLDSYYSQYKEIEKAIVTRVSKF